MADYVPVITRAIARLATNDAPSRDALYQRARAALVEQLRDVATRTELAREEASLEAAIREVEAQYAPAKVRSPDITPIAPLPRLFPRTKDGGEGD